MKFGVAMLELTEIMKYDDKRIFSYDFPLCALLHVVTYQEHWK
jgi:hypothetical protein